MTSTSLFHVGTPECGEELQLCARQLSLRIQSAERDGSGSTQVHLEEAKHRQQQQQQQQKGGQGQLRPRHARGGAGRRGQGQDQGGRSLNGGVSECGPTGSGP